MRVFFVGLIDDMNDVTGIFWKKVVVTTSNNDSVLPHLARCAPAVVTHLNNATSAVVSNRYRLPRTARVGGGGGDGGGRGGDGGEEGDVG